VTKADKNYEECNKASREHWDNRFGKWCKGDLFQKEVDKYDCDFDGKGDATCQQLYADHPGQVDYTMDAYYGWVPSSAGAHCWAKNYWAAKGRRDIDLSMRCWTMCGDAPCKDQPSLFDPSLSR
jgi:hypothetical protein